MAPAAGRAGAAARSCRSWSWPGQAVGLAPGQQRRPPGAGVDRRGQALQGGRAGAVGVQPLRGQPQDGQQRAPLVGVSVPSSAMALRGTAARLDGRWGPGSRPRRTASRSGMPLRLPLLRVLRVLTASRSCAGGAASCPRGRPDGAPHRPPRRGEPAGQQQGEGDDQHLRRRPQARIDRPQQAGLVEQHRQEDARHGEQGLRRGEEGDPQAVGHVAASGGRRTPRGRSLLSPLVCPLASWRPRCARSWRSAPRRRRSARRTDDDPDEVLLDRRPQAGVLEREEGGEAHEDDDHAQHRPEVRLQRRWGCCSGCPWRPSSLLRYSAR